MKKNRATRLGPNALRLTWVPVTQANGSVRMEMRWTAPRQLAQTA